MVLSGIIGAALASLLLGQTRMYKEVGVVTLGVAALCFIWFIEVSNSSAIDTQTSAIDTQTFM